MPESSSSKKGRFWRFRMPPPLLPRGLPTRRRLCRKPACVNSIRQPGSTREVNLRVDRSARSDGWLEKAPAVGFHRGLAARGPDGVRRPLSPDQLTMPAEEGLGAGQQGSPTLARRARLRAVKRSRSDGCQCGRLTWRSRTCSWWRRAKMSYPRVDPTRGGSSKA